MLYFYRVCLFCAAIAMSVSAIAQRSVAREWNELLLEAIREDFARPTVHARNLYHSAIAGHDILAIYDETSESTTLLAGNTVGTYTLPLESFDLPTDRVAAAKEAISHANYRLLRYRFRNSPGRSETFAKLDALMLRLGYDAANRDQEYQSGSPAALGNYLGDRLVRFGIADGSNDVRDYSNSTYEPINPPLVMDEPGNPDIIDPNRWQALKLNEFVDQSGNPIPGGQQSFLGAEWGSVVPFALTPEDATRYTSDGFEYTVYHDPGPPPLITDDATRLDYQRGFEMVARWSGLLDPADGELIDISPAASGRFVDPLPDKEDYFDFYREREGGDTTTGLRQNPITGQPYAPNIVRRADYARVLAEFWADGPDSETPPGHWFTLLNYVLDQPEFSRKWRGQGPVLSPIEYDLRAYLALGAAMHDAAISTWGIKGRYDYLRPVSAIRYMAERGQRTDPAQPNYHPHGLVLEQGFSELIAAGDPLAGANGEFVDNIKLWAWLGPEAIEDPETDVAGVGWIRAKEWWPYQRPTFVSPPFAGYVSGHSTFSRAAADVLTAVTGSPYFPGGLGSFVAPANEFLVFEEGPSQTVELQWASYRDASDEVSLSRIYGGIHPPADDIPGRKIGGIVAADVLTKAYQLFDNEAPTLATTADASVLTPANEVTVLFTFSEAVDTGSFAWSLPEDVDSDKVTVQDERWVEDSEQSSYSITFLADDPSAYVYRDVQLSVEARDLNDNRLVATETAPLFDIDYITSSVAGTPVQEVRVFPSPFEDVLHVTFGSEAEVTVTVHNFTGQQVAQRAFVGTQADLDLAALAPGVYVATVRTAQELVQSWRIVKQ